MSLIELKNVSLDYTINSGSDSLRKAAAVYFQSMFRNRHNKKFTEITTKHYRALNNISLSLDKGDRLGLIGPNGAGKSTLLRVLAKVYQPHSGSVKINGKISNLFDIKLGMNVDATGAENIVDLVTLRGYSKKYALNKLDEIAAFTDLGGFLSQPVRTYSSGMKMRLAFSIVTSFPYDILLIDEGIGTGDARFMKKSKQRLSQALNSSDVLVLASHSNRLLEEFCNKAIVLDKGEIQFVGNVKESLDFYEKNLT